VWQQIPAIILDSAASHFEWVMKTPQSLHSLLRAAAFASKGASERLSDQETRLQGLEQQLVHQETRMQGMEQQVVQLQGSIAAVLAHLPSEMADPAAGGQP
jgi:hypothetical protein